MSGRWDTYAQPGSAATHCQPCYNAKCRDRYEFTLRKAKFNANTLVRAAARKAELDAIRGVKPTGRPWVAMQETVYATETNCAICGEFVDQSLHDNSAMARSVDHIVPVSANGFSYRRENLRLAHRGCNSKRGAFVPSVRVLLNLKDEQLAKLRTEVLWLRGALEWRV